MPSVHIPDWLFVKIIRLGYDEDSFRKFITDAVEERLRLEAVHDRLETPILRMDGPRCRYVDNHPLKPGEIYLSWVTSEKPPTGYIGSRCHAVFLEEETLELSRDGEHWLSVTNLTESVDMALRVMRMRARAP